MKETKIKALIVTMLLLCVALSIGCTDKPVDTPANVVVQNQDEDAAASAEKQTDVPASVIIEESTEAPVHIPLSEVQYEDVEYLRYVLDHTRIMLICSNEIAKSANEADFEALEMSGIGLQTHSTRALRELKQFNISPSLKPHDKEYTLYLEDMYLSGKHLEKGAKYLSIEDIKLSTNYVYKATSHLDRAATLLPG